MVLFVAVVNFRIVLVISCWSPKQEALGQKSLCFHYWDTWLSLCQAAACGTSTHTLIRISTIYLIGMLARAKLKNTPFASICFQGKGQSGTPNQPQLLSKNSWGKAKAKNIISNLNALIWREMPGFSGQRLELMETFLLETKPNFHINMMVGTHCILPATVMEFTQWSYCFPMHIYLSESEIPGKWNSPDSCGVLLLLTRGHSNECCQLPVINPC